MAIVEKGVLSKIEDYSITRSLVLGINPTSIRRQRTTSFDFHRRPGGLLGLPVFNALGDWVVSMDLLLYTREGLHGLMIQQQAFLETLLLPSEVGGSPPEMVIGFGSQRFWVGVLTSLQIIDEEFSKDLTPIRSRASISMVETTLGTVEDAAWLRDKHTLEGGVFG